MELLARAKALEAQGRDIVHMEIGEPDFPTPQPMIDAGMRALKTGAMFYTPALGMPALREAISRFYLTRYGVAVPASRVVVTTGSSSALILATAALVDQGDEVLMADPGYPANRHFVRLMEGKAVGVPVGPESRYQLTPELVEQHWSARTVAALVATPSNPAGTLIPHEHLMAMAAVAKRRDGVLIVDEIYHGLVYEDAVRTAVDAGDNVLVVNSFSKYFSMTGWRLGWMVVPDAYVRDIDKLAQNMYLSAPTPAQMAALAAFTPRALAICDDRRDAFRQRRDFLAPALRSLGFEIPQLPQGAFYIYAGCGRFTCDSLAFARDLLEQAGVAITPGIDFGDHGAHEHVRFAYTQPVEVLREGVARIDAWLRRG